MSFAPHLQVAEEIASAQSTIELLLPQGDYAAALDVLDSMRATCLTHPVTSLHAFRHLPSQLIDTSEVSLSLPALNAEQGKAFSFERARGFAIA